MNMAFEQGVPPDDEEILSVEEEALLLRQCRLNKVEMVEKMLDSGRIGANFVFSNSDAILIIACKCGYKKMVVSVNWLCFAAPVAMNVACIACACTKIQPVPTLDA